MVAPKKSSFKFATQYRNSISVTNVVETEPDAVVGNAEDTSRHVKEVLDTVVPRSLQGRIVLLQFHEHEHNPGEGGALELVRLLKSGSPCWAVLYVSPDGVYGADGSHETYFWPLPGRAFSDADWALFCAEAAEFYYHSQDLGQAVTQALDSMR